MKTIYTELASLVKNKIVIAAGIFTLTFIVFSSHTCKTDERTKAELSERTIQVTGSSEMTIEPDDIEFIVGIYEDYSGSGSPKRSLAHIGKTEAQIREKLASLGVKKDDIKTELDVYSYWYWYENRNTSVSKQLKFKVSDFSVINKFVEELDVKGLQYMRLGDLSHEKILEYRKQVKKDALKAAKEKASYLLESIDKKAGDIISITEIQEKSNDGNWWGYYPSYGSNSNMLSNSASSVSSGGSSANGEVRSIKLRYEVQTTFQIMN